MKKWILSILFFTVLTPSFAQSEVDVIWNYPAPSAQQEEEGNFSIISIPYFDLQIYEMPSGKSDFVDQ